MLLAAATAPLLSGCAALPVLSSVYGSVSKLPASKTYKVLLVCTAIAVAVLLIGIAGSIVENIRVAGEKAYKRKAARACEFHPDAKRATPGGHLVFCGFWLLRFLLDTVFIVIGMTCAGFAWTGLTPRFVGIFEDGPAFAGQIPDLDITLLAIPAAFAAAYIGGWLHYVGVIRLAPARVVAVFLRREEAAEEREADKQRSMESERRAENEKASIKRTMAVGGYHERGELGEGVNYQEAFDCYIELARKGHTPAIRKVVEYYVFGRCMPPDPVEALAWLYSMGDQMNAVDRAQLAELERLLGSAGIRSAQARSKEIRQDDSAAR